MKRHFILIVLTVLQIAAHAQNVGIGNPSPNEKLDVTGNINVTGTIKANGIDGTANQVLMKNSSGNLAWGDMSEYKNISVYVTPGSGNWIVPAGITKVWVEVWGAGGGGSWYGGGGGGGYVGGIFDVTPASTFSYIIGTAGTGGGASGNTGGTSSIVYNPNTITLTATGGSSISTSGTLLLGGTGGSYSFTSGFYSCIGALGEAAQATFPSLMQYSATAYIDCSTGGDGGNGANSSSTGGKGGFYVYNSTANTVLRTRLGTNGLIPGGGGGSGYLGIIAAAGIGFANGASGASGRVIIHY